MSLHANLYNEVFLLIESKTGISFATIAVYKTVDALNDDLADFHESMADSIRAFHGVLTPATIIPKDFIDENPYIVVEDPTEVGSAMILETSADVPKELAEQIEKLFHKDSREEIDNAEIDDMFILYGYELTIMTKEAPDTAEDDGMIMRGDNHILSTGNTGLMIEEWDVDELRIGRMLKIAKQANALERKHFHK